jgi:hypothetical protein
MELEQEPRGGPRVKEGRASIVSKDKEEKRKKEKRKKRKKGRKRSKKKRCKEKEMRKKNKNNNPTYLKTIAPLQSANMFIFAIARTPP